MKKGGGSSALYRNIWSRVPSLTSVIYLTWERLWLASCSRKCLRVLNCTLEKSLLSKLTSFRKNLQVSASFNYTFACIYFYVSIIRRILIWSRGLLKSSSRLINAEMVFPPSSPQHHLMASIPTSISHDTCHTLESFQSNNFSASTTTFALFFLFLIATHKKLYPGGKQKQHLVLHRT